MGQAAEEKASSLTAMLYPGGMASFLFAACAIKPGSPLGCFIGVHPAKRNFFLCALCLPHEISSISSGCLCGSIL
jgi:hypothetical protein